MMIVEIFLAISHQIKVMISDKIEIRLLKANQMIFKRKLRKWMQIRRKLLKKIIIAITITAIVSVATAIMTSWKKFVTL